MKKHISRVLAVLAILALGLVLPACESMDGSSTTYVGVGYGVYGYSGSGWGACCSGPGMGGVAVSPPIGPRAMPY